jgi:hypothetical protein
MLDRRLKIQGYDRSLFDFLNSPKYLIMKRLHIAIATQDITATVQDYTERLGIEPCAIIEGEYALWRNEFLNVSVRQDPSCQPGTLRHLGWEDSDATEFITSTDINGIVWEHFSAQQQADEIEEIWPANGYAP